MVRKGSGGSKKVVAAFGEDILQDDGEIDRARLGQIVFSDPSKRQLLNRYKLISTHFPINVSLDLTLLFFFFCLRIYLNAFTLAP